MLGTGTQWRTQWESTLHQDLMVWCGGHAWNKQVGSLWPWWGESCEEEGKGVSRAHNYGTWLRPKRWEQGCFPGGLTLGRLEGWGGASQAGRGPRAGQAVGTGASQLLSPAPWGASLHSGSHFHLCVIDCGSCIWFICFIVTCLSKCLHRQEGGSR